MSEQEKAAKAAPEAEVVVPLRNEIPTPAITFDGTWGTVAVIGANFVSPKFLTVIQHILAAWDEYHLSEGKTPVHHGIHSIVIREDGYPHNDEGKSIYGHALATTGSMAINLEHIFTKSIEDSIDTPRVSIFCHIWQHMILTVCHEMHHLAALHVDPGLKLKDEEKLAREFSMEFSYFLAQNYDIEPGTLAEEPFFGTKMLETIQSFMSDAGEEDMAFWKDQQMKALEGIMYWTQIGEDKEDKILKSFREYMHWTSNDESDDPKWCKLYTKEEPATAAPAQPAAAPAAAVPDATVEMNAYTGEETPVHEVDPHIEMMMDEMGVYEAPPWDDTPAPGAPGTPFVMQGQVVGQNVAPAAPAAASPAPAPTMMPNSSGMAHGLSPADVGAVCIAVYRRLFNHMFTQCEPVKIDNTTIRPDGQGGGCGGFNNITALQNPIPISDIPNADKVFVQMDAKVNGKWSKGVPITGQVIGSDTGPKTMLPKYDLYIITHEGHMEKRTLLPQNPWKTKMGQDGITPEFTKPAVEAQNGKRIMYVYSNDSMKLKVLAEQDASGNWREWLEDANWNVIG